MDDPAQDRETPACIDHGLGDIDAGLVVTDQPAVSCQPAERPLHDPATGQDLETGRVAAPDDLDDEIEEHRLVEHLPPVIGAIGEQVLHPGPALAECVEDRLRPRRCRRCPRW